MTIQPYTRGPRGGGAKPAQDTTPVNHKITAKTVRLIDPDGAMLGVVSLQEGLSKAEEYGLDLVAISPNAEPPVCKIMDYGKYRYEIQKKAKEAKKKQKVVQIKEIKLRPGIEDHDYQVKLRASRGFIEEGDKVKFTLRFRGREMAHQDIGMEVLKRMEADMADIARPEMSARMEGRQLVMVLMPK